MNVFRIIDALGHNAEDKITGTKGIVTSISFDLYGCVQVIITQKSKDKLGEDQWLDFNRLHIDWSKDKVMDVPKKYFKLKDFENEVESSGPALKPIK